MAMSALPLITTMTYVLLLLAQSTTTEKRASRILDKCPVYWTTSSGEPYSSSGDAFGGPGTIYAMLGGVWGVLVWLGVKVK